MKTHKPLNKTWLLGVVAAASMGAFALFGPLQLFSNKAVEISGSRALASSALEDMLTSDKEEDNTNSKSTSHSKKNIESRSVDINYGEDLRKRKKAKLYAEQVWIEKENKNKSYTKGDFDADKLNSKFLKVKDTQGNTIDPDFERFELAESALESISTSDLIKKLGKLEEDFDAARKSDKTKENLEKQAKAFGEYKSILTYLNDNRSGSKVTVDNVPEGFADFCTSCHKDEILDKTHPLLSLEEIEDEDGLSISFVSSIADTGDVLKKYAGKISAKNTDNKKDMKAFNAALKKRRKCEVDEDLDLEKKVTKADRQSCYLNLVQNLVEGREEHLYEDEVEKEQILTDAVDALMKERDIISGDLRDRIYAHDSILDSLGVRASKDYQLRNADSIEGRLAAKVLISRYAAQTTPEVKSMNELYAKAYKYDAKNKTIIQNMEKVFGRNGINEYMHFDTVDPSLQQTAASVNKSALELYCGAKANMDMIGFDWACRNIYQPKTAAEILAELNGSNSVPSPLAMNQQRNGTPGSAWSASLGSGSQSAGQGSLNRRPLNESWNNGNNNIQDQGHYPLRRNQARAPMGRNQWQGGNNGNGQNPSYNTGWQPNGPSNNGNYNNFRNRGRRY